MSGYGEVIGYYVGEDMFGPYCPNCYAATMTPDGEPRESDTPIFACGHEADTPSHCGLCEALIPHDLTPDGVEYVRDAVRRLQAGEGREEIVRQWQDYYLRGEDPNSAA